tara:strand:- start:86 stop:274 length:189 start_codon:yes stop_codon:yes gene_type:complete
MKKKWEYDGDRAQDYIHAAAKAEVNELCERGEALLTYVSDAALEREYQRRQLRRAAQEDTHE